MTDRFAAFTVILEENMREDDAQPLMDAIRHLRGVISVKGNVVDIDLSIAEARIRRELKAKLLKAFEEPLT